MNILINFLFKEGAGPVFSLELARAFANNGCNVYAVLSSKIANRKQWENEKLLKGICFLETGTRKTAISSTVKFLLYKHNEVKEYFKDIKFDYVIQTFYHPWAGFVNKQVKEKGIITICHDPVLHSGVKRFEIFQTKRFIKNSDEIIVLTKSFIPIVHNNYGFAYEKIHYMPHGRMSEYKKNKVSINESLYDEGNINFLFFGRISQYKGLHILSESFSKLEKDSENVTLTIAGSGDFSEYEYEYSKLNNIKVINEYIPDEDVGKYFDNPNVITVLPYLDATQSGVIPIALEYGTPIIASDTGGLREQLDHGNMGIYAKAGDSEELYNKMKYALKNPEYLEQEKAKMKKFLEELDWDKVVGNLLATLTNKLKSGNLI